LRRVSVVILVAVLCVALLAGPGMGADLRDQLERQQAELDRIQREIDAKSRLLQEAEKRERSLWSQLQEVERQLARQQSELEAIEAELRRTEAELTRTSEILVRTEAELQRKDEYLAQRVRALYIHGPIGYLEVLLGATSFGDLLSRAEYLGAIIAQDIKLLEEVKVQKRLYEEEKARWEAQKRRLELLRADAQAKKRQIEASIASRRQLLERIQRDQKEYRQALDELEAMSQKLVKVIQELQEKIRRQRNRGLAMIWPYKGTITSYFGPRYHPILKEMRNHTGLDIATPWGVPVVAAEEGVVIYSGWLGGYGNTVIIDHGNGVSTLYAHNSKLLVFYGQEVDRGQRIALSGSTGFSTGPHVHFEVRVDGAPVNPLSFLPQ